MKKHILSFLFTTLSIAAFAQQPVADSVSLGAPVTAQVQPVLVTDSIALGAGYTNDVYYNMRNGSKSTVAGNNWHIAFAVRKMTQTAFQQAVSIIANEGRGVSVYASTQTNWSTFDTTGAAATWANPHNSDSTWNIGAFNAGANPANPFDFGWGMYNPVNHNVEGNKIYLVKITGSATTYKKLTIASLALDSAWTFTYANLDNSDSTTHTILKKSYNNKLFAYHNLLNDSTHNREPNGKWDVLFTRFGAYSTQSGVTSFAPTTSVLSYPTVGTSKVTNTPTDISVPGLYTYNLTGIGTDWKINPGVNPGFTIKDSLSYFTNDAANEQSKLVFLAFRGSSTGVIVFKRGNALPQTVTLETFPNDVFYHMGTGHVSTVAGSNWHLAFAMRNAAPPFNVMRSTTIWANEGRGVTVYESTQPVTNFSGFDTTGHTTWAVPHNSDSTWDIGALNANRTTSATDFGWGEYDMITHDLAGTKIFLIRIAKGSAQNPTYIYKKMMVEKLAFDTSWVFTYANLDNSGSKTVTINKSAFAGKLFAYHNLLNDSTLDREPSAKWDLLFTRYGAYSSQFGQTVFSTNTGALSHPTLLTSKVSGVPTDSAQAGVYTNLLTGIGTDWKTNPGPGQPGFVVKDSLSYFTKDDANHESKLVFVSFVGSSTGTIVFHKTNFTLPLGLKNIAQADFVNIYPNPAKGNLNIELTKTGDCTVSIMDIAGRSYLTSTLTDLNNSLNISALQSGVYFVRLQQNNSQQVVKLIVQ